MERSERILIVDDEQMFRDTTAELLGYRGYECDCAEDAITGQKLLAENDYDLLISDIKMPGNLNLELIHHVQQRLERLPVILVTGFPSIDTAVESVELQVHAYLLKPVDFDELLEKVRECLKRSHAHRQIGQAKTHLAQWRERLKQADSLLEHLDDSRSGTSLDGFVTLNLGIVSDVLDRLGRMVEELAACRSEEEEQSVIASSHLNTARDAIVETVGVLKGTKDLFKSKQLARLRRKLEGVIDVWPLPAGSEKEFGEILLPHQEKQATVVSK